MGKTIDYAEMEYVFKEALYNNSYIIIVRNYEFGSSITGTEELDIGVDDELVSFRDINDMSMKIKRCYIKNIELSENILNKEIKIGLGENNITFMICE